MLPAASRLRSSADFAAVTRRGSRVRSGGVVLYLLADPASEPARCGLIVSKSVGSSVVRHRVSRRLRAQLAQRLTDLPAGARLVVRALPACSDESSADLGRDLDRAVRRLAEPGTRASDGQSRSDRGHP